MDVPSFADIEEEFLARVRRIVWCTMATVDRRGRPRSRIMHPIWAGQVCWMATQRGSFKGKHLARNPYVSLSYWDQQHQQVYADCRAEWADDPAEKQRVWELYKSTPPPLGYDLATFFVGGPDDPNYGLLKLTPWRIELWSLPDMMSAVPNKVWRADQASPSVGQPRFVVARPNLHVREVEGSVAFYRDVLGFEIEHVMGEPPSFALLRRDGAEIALVRQDGATPSGCYIYVTGVEQLHERCVAAGLRISSPLTLQPWGLLDFVVQDPDGHHIAIGERKAAH